MSEAMTDHFELVGTALTFADLGSIVQKTVQRHVGALESMSGPPWVLDYQPKIEAVLQSVNATTEVLKYVSVQLDRETLGEFATTAVRKSALKAFNSCDNAFESIHRYYLQHPSENMRPSYKLDEYDRLLHSRKRLDKARTSLLLIVAVLQLRKDMSTSYDDYLSISPPADKFPSNKTTIPLQRLQIENLVTQMKAMDEDIDDSASGDGESNAGSDSSWDIRSRDSTPRSAISNHRDGSRDSKARSPSRHRLSWLPSTPGSEPRCTSVEPPRRRTSITPVTSPAAPPIDPFLPIPDGVPPFMAKPTFANLLMQTAHSASAFSEMLATETYGWYNSNRVYMNSIRCALDILNQNFGDLLVSYEQSAKGGSDAPPLALTDPFPIVDLADQAPKKKSKKSKEKKNGTKKARKESKFTECWDPPVTNMAPPPVPIELFADPFADLQNFVGPRDFADANVPEEILVPKLPREKKRKIPAFDEHAADDKIETSVLPDPKSFGHRDYPAPPAPGSVDDPTSAQRRARDPAHIRTQQFRVWQDINQPAARSIVGHADSQGSNAANAVPTIVENDPVDDWDTFAVIGKKGKKTHKKTKKSTLASELIPGTGVTSTTNDVVPPRKKHSRKAAGDVKDSASDGLIEPPPPPSEKDMMGGLAFPFPPTSYYIPSPPPPPPRAIGEDCVPPQKERKNKKGSKKHGYLPAMAESVKDDDWIWNQMRSHVTGTGKSSQKPKDAVDDLLQQWTTGDAMSSDSDI
ncbi:hypothetical protein CKM354_000163900 [Cercospora kikuchii]|uniref:Uncharacterized protein n=1 Tax=Cercospora kikuchii TaxID=84275 RepID=A0A9P3C8M6_9PEZI|nr:uncharacterized protein CKM354_000163900 [Cercospora kikuchii]GIZ38216.1 hypothetical protein CKM354_000163900 [Cercospora kikuchii]